MVNLHVGKKGWSRANLENTRKKGISDYEKVYRRKETRRESGKDGVVLRGKNENENHRGAV